MNNILEWMWIFAITIIQTIHKYLDILLSKFRPERNRKVCWKSELCDVDYTYSKEEYDRKYLNVETTFNPYYFIV